MVVKATPTPKPSPTSAPSTSVTDPKTGKSTSTAAKPSPTPSPSPGPKPTPPAKKTASSSNKSTTDSSSTTFFVPDVSSSVPVIRPGNLGQGKALFNPPAHVLTRSLSALAARTSLQNVSSDDATQMQWGIKNQNNDIARAMSDLKLGYIFQDPDNNNNTTDSKNLAGRAFATQVWGFQFTYNPTTISQSLTNDPTTDYLLHDSANLLSGTSVLNFQLYLNRIHDLPALRSSYDKGYADFSGTANYGRELTNVERNGILKRGTNYDLEFLFRCMNGDPVTDAPMLGGLTTDGTADFGYMTGIPVWLRLGETQLYKVSIQSINITHLMFNVDYIPVLTTVDITAARMPVIGMSQEASTARAQTGASYRGSQQSSSSSTTTNGSSNG